MSIINDALKKAQKTKESALFPDREGNSGVRLEFQKKQGFNWGSLFVLLVLFLITGPIIAPLFSLPMKKEAFLNVGPIASKDLAVISSKPIKEAAESFSSTRKAQFGIEETPRLPSTVIAPPAFSALSSRPDFALSGIVYNPKESYCILNDKIVKIGERVSGAKLLAITPEKVVLDYQGETISLVA